MQNPLVWFGLIIVAAGVTILVLVDVISGVDGAQGSRIVGLIASIALLVVIGGGALGSYRGRGTMALQHFAIWLAIAAVLALVYSYRGLLGLNID